MSVRLLLTSGRGPAECRVALASVLRAIEREAAGFGLDASIATGPGGDQWGPASAILVLGGDGAQALARRWSGSILWVAESPVRPHHKRKNWFVGVVELPAHPQGQTALDASAVRFETFRAGGPGGQHQNKTESAVRAIDTATGLSAVARDGRSQHRNRALALERLATLVTSSAELARHGDRAAVHRGHDTLERGKPIRRFLGPDFREG